MKLFKRRKKKKTVANVIQPKRKPVKGGTFRIFNARTRRRHRAATTGEAENNFSNVGVARALVVILGLHIIAIGGIFYHNQHFEKSGKQSGASIAEKVDPVEEPAENKTKKSPSYAAGGAAYVVVKGDDYAKIAEHYGVDEQKLRLANWNVQLRPGRILRIPAQQDGFADGLAENEMPDLPPAVGTQGTSASSQTAVLVKPKAPRAQIVSPPSAKSATYVVKPGDSVWRISQNFKVSQDALMKANGISNPRKLRVGMKLKIPK